MIARSLVFVALIFVPQIVQAQNLGRAEAQYRRASFARTLRTLEAIEADGPPSDYPRFLELRALASHALQRDSNALSLLALVAPDHELTSDAPPDLRERWAALTSNSEELLRLTVDVVVRNGNSTVVIATTEGELSAEVTRIEVYARADIGQWVSGENEVMVPRVPAEVDVYAKVFGRHDALLAHLGDEAEPVRRQVVDLGVAAVAGQAAEAEREAEERARLSRQVRNRRIVGFSIASAVIVAGTIVAILFATRPEPTTFLIPEE